MFRKRLRIGLNISRRCSPPHLVGIGYGWHGLANKYVGNFGTNRRTKSTGQARGLGQLNRMFDGLHIKCFFFLQAGLSAAPARAVSAVKSMNIPQQIKDMKLPDLPQAIKV